MITNLLQSIINGLGDFGRELVSALPGSPFQAINAVMIDNKLLSYISWVIPVQQILSLLQLWTVAIGVYYLCMLVMRWVKMIS